MRLFSQLQWWGLTQVNTCGGDSSLLGCSISNFPVIITGLLVVALALIGVRLFLYWRERIGQTTRLDPSPPSVPVTPTRPGTQVQPNPPPPPPPAPRPTPLQIRIADPPDLKLSSFKGDMRIQNDFGDLLSAVFLASQGWKQLQSKYHGDRGIDGLFVREVRGGGGCECLAIDSRANATNYDPANMSDAKLAADVAQLYELGAFPKQTADELMRGLHQGSSFFRKELWRHDLSSGLTTISELGRKGDKGRSVTRSNARLMSALYLSMEHFDRASIYLGQPPLDDTP